MRFVDLFAGLGGFHQALSDLGHECVFASEIDEQLRHIYIENFPETRGRVFGDIREHKNLVPRHDILCAGFPCQPFSKSGYQKGQKDRTRGTLFHEIIAILKNCRPQYVILENVGNFERHNNGRTWQIVRESLEGLGYDVKGTVHIRSQGHGLLSPHHFGYPHHRERFFVVASQARLPSDPFPKGDRNCVTSLDDVVQRRSELTKLDRAETALSHQQVECVEHWNRLLKRIPAKVELPSFPIWGDEIGADYPFEKSTPHATSLRHLRRLVTSPDLPAHPTKDDLIRALPSYARSQSDQFPNWKVAFIRQNREWLASIEPAFPAGWVSKLKTFPPSLRKLEWNCKGEERDLWRHVLQFRPSGLRAKRYSSAPALVAMTTTQVPIIGPRRRFLTRTEALRLQGFRDDHVLPETRADAFAALGNAVHVGLVTRIVETLLNVK